MSNRDEYIRKMQVKLVEWNTEINMLIARAGEIAVDVKNEYNEQIEALKLKQASAKVKIEALQQAGDNAWEDLRSGIEQAGVAMGEAIDAARSRFR